MLWIARTKAAVGILNETKPFLSNVCAGKSSPFCPLILNFDRSALICKAQSETLISSVSLPSDLSVSDKILTGTTIDNSASGSHSTRIRVWIECSKSVAEK